MMNGYESIGALANLLGAADNGGAQRQTQQRVNKTPISQLTPAAFAPASVKKQISAPPPKKKEVKDIWDEDEVDYVVDNDPRPEPEYDIKLRQKVASEDIFLGMGGKLPSQHHCDEVVIEIELPGVKMAEVDVDVTSTRLDLRCPQYKLSLPLPYTVNDKQGNAKWDGKRSKLIVSVPIKHELPMP